MQQQHCYSQFCYFFIIINCTNRTINVLFKKESSVAVAPSQCACMFVLVNSWL